jgi:hypothetical protein
MRTSFHDLSSVKHNDLVSVGDRRKAVTMMKGLAQVLSDEISVSKLTQ